MKEHFQEVDADVVGVVEADATGGVEEDVSPALMAMMNSLGYSSQCKARPDNKSAIAIFYKHAKICLLETEVVPFGTGKDNSKSASFLMQCLFCLVDDPKFIFAFAETQFDEGLGNAAGQEEIYVK